MFVTQYAHAITLPMCMCTSYDGDIEKEFVLFSMTLSNRAASQIFHMMQRDLYIVLLTKRAALTTQVDCYIFDSLIIMHRTGFVSQFT